MPGMSFPITSTVIVPAILLLLEEFIDFVLLRLREHCKYSSEYFSGFSSNPVHNSTTAKENQPPKEVMQKHIHSTPVRTHLCTVTC